jgi:beta-glucosidase
VLVNGGAVSTEGFDQMGGAKGHGASAIVEAFNPNVVGAKALASLMFGTVNTWGKLPVTIYPSSFTDKVAMEDFDMTAPPGRTYKYHTGDVNFAFGSGLSYTTFGMKCALEKHGGMTQAVAGSSIQCTVTNSGNVDGDEVVMMFARPTAAVRAKADHVLPLKRLVGFDRLRLARGASGSVTLPFDHATFASSNSTGGTTLHSGVHELVLWRGNGAEQVFQVTV